MDAENGQAVEAVKKNKGGRPRKVAPPPAGVSPDTIALIQ